MPFLRFAAAALLLIPADQVTADRSEVEAALAILDTLAQGREPSSGELATLFASPGYRRLKERERAMHRDFTDAEFIAFLRSDEARGKAPGWHRALTAWSTALAGPAAAKARAYLPADAELRATIFPMIKPRPNQFVFDLSGDPAIFLYLDPAVPPAKSANTMAHELHHIGLGSVCRDKEGGDPRVASLRHWTSAFGEGLAMLAAAGGPDLHPHAESSAEERAGWDANAARFDAELAEQNAYFLRVLDGDAGDAAAIEARMRGYFGVQGPWYTVGWRMAQVIEHNLGRARTIDAFCRSGALLAAYNEAAARELARTGLRLPIWDRRLAAALAGS